VTQRAPGSPDFNTTTRRTSPELGTLDLNQSQRMPGPGSFVAPRGGRLTAGRGGSPFSRGDDDDEPSMGGGLQYKTITVREDDEFYKAYLRRGRASPLGYVDSHNQRGRFHDYSSSRRDNVGEEKGTSRFDDGNFGDDSEVAATIDDGLATIGWYERRNRFLDLSLHVQGMQTRVVRTPEMEHRRAQGLKRERGHS